MSAPPRLCIYCGNSGVTKEHLWGKWSIKYARKTNKRNTHIVSKGAALSPFLTNGTKGTFDRPGSSRSQTLKIVCRTCNNGWMKKIVDEAIPVLVNLHDGNWDSLNLDCQTKLASWIIMFSMNYEFAHKDSVCVTQKARTDFSLNPVPTPHWDIGVGHRKFGNEDPILHRAMRFSEKDTIGHPQSQLTVFGFGDLIAVAYYHEYMFKSYRPYPFPHTFEKHGLVPLWPIRSDKLAKPASVYQSQSLVPLLEIITQAL